MMIKLLTPSHRFLQHSYFVTVSRFISGFSFCLGNINVHSTNLVITLNGLAAVSACNYVLNRRAMCSQADSGYRCTRCDLVFRRKSSLDIHFMRMHANKFFHCHLCRAGYGNKASLMQHLNQHLQKFVCCICDKSFSRPSELKEHELRHGDARTFDCVICGAFFKNDGDRSRHIKTAHYTGSLLVCDKCGLGFQHAQDLFKHLKVHELPEQEVKKCEHCSAAFASQLALNVHKRTCLSTLL